MSEIETLLPVEQPRLVVPLWSDPRDKAVCPSCDHKGEYYNGLPFVCESCEVAVDENDQCHTPDCPCCATRPQCPKCGSGMWSADTQAEYETGWPEPRASALWHNDQAQPPATGASADTHTNQKSN